jgi:predicted GNAT family N-acyltransferase
MKLRFLDGENRVDPMRVAWIDLRERVLRTPLGLTLSMEDLVTEQADRHLLAFEGETVIGGLIVQRRDQVPGAWKIRQVAVEPSWQGRGVGHALMLAVETAARDAGIKNLVLNSRESVCGFYEKLGYVSEGEPFTEVGIPHRRMQLSLSFIVRFA